jgi:hypothetical protein
MKKLFTCFSILISCMVITGCKFPELDFFKKRCTDHIPQKYKFGFQEFQISTTARKLHVADTVFINLHLEENFYDSLSRGPVGVHGNIAAMFRLTLAMYGNNPFVFAVDTTIYKVFDQYFDTVLKAGKKKQTYIFEGVRRNGYWDIDVAFVAKRKGAYEIYSEFTEISVGETLPKGVCMLGNVSTLDARLKLHGINNRIGEVYPIMQEGVENMFGLIVE